MSAPSPASAAALLGIMAKGAAVFAASTEDGDILADTLDSVASYSIDPPSVLVAVPGHLTEALPGRFGISLLSAGQESVTALLRARRREHEIDWERLGDAPVVPDALAQVLCESSLVERSLGDAIVVGEVLEVSLGTGRPLVVASRSE